LLICASPDLESELCRTPFWREDLERYVAERTEEARMLALATEPHIVVVERGLPGAEELVAALRALSLPHTVSIVALSRDAHAETGSADTILTLPVGPDWDERLLHVLQVQTRQQERFEVRFDIDTLLRQTPGSHRGLALNMSAGGILIESPGLRLFPGDDVGLSIPLPGSRHPVEGRARVIRQPAEERLGLRFEAFADDGDVRVRDFLASLSPRAPA
jgi:hypothetical protein